MVKKKIKVLAVIAVAMMFWVGCSYPDDNNDSNGGANSSSGSSDGNSSPSGGGSYIFEDFSGSGTPTGWTYSNFSRRTSSGIDNTACLGFSTNNNSTASVTTAFVAMGANPILSFNYKVTTSACCYGPTSTAAANGAVQYTVFVSTDNGTTWTSIDGHTDIRYISSPDYERIHVDLSAYANRTIGIRITFARQTDAYVLIDDIALGNVPPIFSGTTTMTVGNVYNNYSTKMSINTRTYRISNKGASPMVFNEPATTGGITIIGLPSSLDAFDTTTINVDINASAFSTYSTYSGNFSFNTNDASRPSVAVNVTGDVIRAPAGDFQDFSGSGTPTGWTYSNFSRRTSGGIDNTACLGFSTNNNSTASVTTALVATGTNPILSFNYKVTTSACCYSPTSNAAADGAVLYNVYISADDGATWANVLTDVSHVSSQDFETITVNLPAEYANQIIRALISFARVTDAYVLLDDIAIN